MNELLEMLENPNDKLICVDLDNTITTSDGWNLDNIQPNQAMIDKMLVWFKKGAHIIIYTARPGAVYPQTMGWLIAHKVPFHGIAMQIKPGADLYIDDKALNSKQV